MPNLGMPELIMIFIIALLVFGPKQLPEIGRAIGKALKVFQKANQDIRNSMRINMDFDKPRNYPPPTKVIHPEETENNNTIEKSQPDE